MRAGELLGLHWLGWPAFAGFLWCLSLSCGNGDASVLMGH